MATSQVNDLCLCCGALSTGVHFGINSCRGCSSFFKRCQILGKVYTCRYEENCVTETGSTRFCKACRLNKLIKLGMILKKGRSPKTPNLLSEDQSKVSFLGNDSYNPVIEKINLLFNKFPQPYYFDLSVNRLQMMAQSLKNYFIRLNVSPLGNVLINQSFELNEYIEWKRLTFVANAELLMRIPEFEQIMPSTEVNERLFIYRHFWPVQSSLVGVKITADVFGSTLFPLYSMFTGRIALNCNIPPKETLSYIKGCPKNSLNVMEKDLAFHTQYLLKPYKQTMPTEIEFAYLTLQIFCTMVNKKHLTPKSGKSLENLEQIISKEIHNYYVYEANQPNYIFRLAEINKLISAAYQHSRQLKETCEMGKIFKVIDTVQTSTAISSLL